MSAIQIIPFILFITNALFCLSFIVRFNYELFQAVRALENAYLATGRKWNYWSDIQFRRTLYSNPSGILDVTDAFGIENAKRNLIAVRATVKMYFVKVAKFSAVWFVSTPTFLLIIVISLKACGIPVP